MKNSGVFQTTKNVFHVVKRFKTREAETKRDGEAEMKSGEERMGEGGGVKNCRLPSVAIL